MTSKRFELVETDGNDVTLRSSEAFPPGTPLAVELGDETFRVKVRSCKKTDENAALPFRIAGQFQNLTRAQRDRLTQK